MVRIKVNVHKKPLYNPSGRRIWGTLGLWYDSTQVYYLVKGEDWFRDIKAIEFHNILMGIKSERVLALTPYESIEVSVQFKDNKALLGTLYFFDEDVTVNGNTVLYRKDIYYRLAKSKYFRKVTGTQLHEAIVNNTKLSLIYLHTV